MNLTSPVYLLFLLAACLLYRIAGRFTRFPAASLVVASLYFYALWNPWYCLPLLFTALLDHNVSRTLARTESPRKRRFLLAADIAVNLGILAFFKYFDFLAANASEAAAALGFRLPPAPFRVFFSIGISFYTFQSMSHVIDVYRKDAEPASRFTDYLAFVSFFPTLPAGPITRSGLLLPQLARPAGPLDPERGGKALFLIMLGFLKKRVVADYLAVNLADRVFELPGMYSSLEILLGVYAYAVQIYCDFSGYSDIAIGSALLLGVSLKDNFNAPYRARNLVQFWQRWHISLSQWLRDYLFFALPGNRTVLLPYLNTFLTFGLGGLWHGASWNYLAWGGMHGAGLAALRFLDARRRSRRGTVPSRWRSFAGVFLTFHFVCATWILFRCETFSGALDLVSGLARGSVSAPNVSLSILVALAAGLLPQWLPERHYSRLMNGFIRLPAPLQAAVACAAALVVHRAGGSAISGFIYFRY